MSVYGLLWHFLGPGWWLRKVWEQAGVYEVEMAPAPLGSLLLLLRLKVCIHEL